MKCFLKSYSPTTPLASPLDAGRANICCRPGHHVSVQDHRLAAALNAGQRTLYVRRHVTLHAGNRPRYRARVQCVVAALLRGMARNSKEAVGRQTDAKGRQTDAMGRQTDVMWRHTCAEGRNRATWCAMGRQTDAMGRHTDAMKRH